MALPDWLSGDCFGRRGNGACIIVEPTVSGLHDMQRVAELAAHFKVPGLVCVNKYDLNMEMTEKIEDYALRGI